MAIVASIFGGIFYVLVDMLLALDLLILCTLHHYLVRSAPLSISYR